ncbi:Pleckstrin homology domain-containing protein [Cantharellus anzutake]|uniref:Pleckstrin homology domain-containing protein n=1 Tax=Cantharellus anzutake TaxID=1750568 RepID=UPI001905FF25|nr:Pleckstrin homology domain-containing protein [Cantharellus anzutake]KAF8329534.1 Pleckstrin homology domain-containing protein [Cantharellus anzutake]
MDKLRRNFHSSKSSHWVISGGLNQEEEERCVICLESLSFSFRLPGEKPQIVPECGHALHDACFTAVYGPVVRGQHGRSNLGLCGVCRRPMKLGDGDNTKGNKLAALTGVGGQNNGNQTYPGREKGGLFRVPQLNRMNAPTPTPYDPDEDDPIDPSGSVKSGSSDSTQYVVVPAIQARSEFSSITRSHTTPTRSLTCLVIVELPFVFNPTPPASNSPFAAITTDLKMRMHDWKGHALDGLGPLQMFDILSVRRDALVREFFVYLFREALICVLEEKKRALGRLLHGSSSASIISGEHGFSSKGVLRLKGRIYIRHIKRIIDTSVAGELSLTIDMEDDRLESFILVFKERSQLESWKTVQEALRPSRSHTPSGLLGNGMEEFGGNSKAARILSIGSVDTVSSRLTSQDSVFGSSQRSTLSSSTTASSRQNGPLHHYSSYHQPPLPTVVPHYSAGTSNSLSPVSHTPLDLICVISLPPPTSNASTASLKLRVIRNTLDFVLTTLGSKDRLSLVTFEFGPQGRIRKTPFLCPGRAQSKNRLVRFIETLDKRDADDEFLVPPGKDEKADVVTAVNHGLDVVLQRKSKNPLSGLILVSDTADSTRRAQMDLVLARAEAANVPIHSFGYGKAHDPASLWLMSNHTNGTYTFVKDWYDLRDCFAGCLGGMMSIALTNVKLHLRVVDLSRFKMRKVSGASHAIVASDGRDVHVDIGELRFGEKKEMLVEVELHTGSETNGSMTTLNGSSVPNATERFVQGLGRLSLDDSSPTLVDGMMDGMIDEMPVFELDGSFYDPAVAKTASRLANPVLLTITLLPASATSKGLPTPASDVVIVRRRMELLASDMITRALVLISRKNIPQAQKILEETKRILHTVLQNVSQYLTPVATQGSVRSRKELLNLAAVRTLQSILQDLQVLIDALEDNQAMILRDQKSWSGRTPTEKLFWSSDNSLELVARSHDWVSSVQE